MPSHDRRHHLVGQRREEADAERDPIPPGTGENRLHRPLGLTEHELCLASQDLPDGGQRHATTRAMQEGLSDPSFEHSDLL